VTEIPVARVALLAMGVALSPLPIVAVLIILLTKRARVGSLVFSAAWVLGNAAAIALAVAFAGSLGRPRQGLDLPAEGLVTVLLGIGLFTTAWLSRRRRWRSEDPQATPKWVEAVDGLSPLGGAVVAFSNALTSPKNLALAIAAGVTIRAATRIPAEIVASSLLYVAVASLTIVTPVVVYLIAGKRAEPLLARWKQRVTSRAAVVMEIGLFVFGLGLALKGLYNLLT
jgi:hypothetical protein